MAYTPTTRRLVNGIRADVNAIADAQVRDLVAAWVAAWNEIAPDLNAVLLELLVSGERVSRAKLLRSQRLLQTLMVIRDHLDQLALEGRTRIVGDLDRVIEVAGGAQASVIDSQLPPGGSHLLDLRDWSRMDPAGIEAIVRRTTQQITSAFNPLSASADRAVRRELIRGYAAGTNPRATAARIIARTEGQFNGGLTRALRIARTETLDAARAGALLGRMQNADVLQGWIWCCELGPTSCSACIAMHGTVFAPEDPGPFDHPNGRCTSVPLTKSWADLGFDELEPDYAFQTGPEWFADQAEPTQRQILGPARYSAYQSGHYPPTAWAETRHNDGWRDSVQATRAPRQSGGRTSSGSAA